MNLYVVEMPGQNDKNPRFFGDFVIICCEYSPIRIRATISYFDAFCKNLYSCIGLYADSKIFIS